MAVENESIVYSCDWVDENEQVCGFTQRFSGRNHFDSAREADWGWYTNDYIRRDRWGKGANAWFCPTHAKVFGNNHGWGDLEDYGPPNTLWGNLVRRVKK